MRLFSYLQVLWFKFFHLLTPITCRLGFHWFMVGHEPDFVDVVSGKIVYLAMCPCGRIWFVDTISRFPTFKVESNRPLGGFKAYVKQKEEEELLNE